ncbi:BACTERIOOPSIN TRANSCRIPTIONAL ACTIVATOR [Salix koriyanagi]|uniref:BACTERIOOPSIN TRANSCRIPTIONAL ACTIVATOR n=1 Tax=Salix koriyanagi TaxID=2511006 RepID=A0A9Q1ADT5_9ROSI|nr:BACTERIOOPSIN TRANSCRIPTIONAL ACTIVATOR [Salix koriyanagi]
MRQNDTWVGQVVICENLGITLSWRLLDARSVAPPPRGAHAACCIDKRTMVIHGGIGLYGLRLGDTWILEVPENFCSGTWRELVAHPSPPPRSGHTLTCIEGTGTVLFGGRGLGYDVLHDVWLLQASEDQLKWVQMFYNLQDIPEGVSLPASWPLSHPNFGRSTANLWSQLHQTQWDYKQICGEGSRQRVINPTADHSIEPVQIIQGVVYTFLVEWWIAYFTPTEASELRFDGELFLVKLELETGSVRC